MVGAALLAAEQDSPGMGSHQKAAVAMRALGDALHVAEPVEIEHLGA